MLLNSFDSVLGLNGEPGEYVTIARRRGDRWFVGAMTNWKARELDVRLEFLGAGRYEAEIYADGKEADLSPKQVSISRQTARAGTLLKIRLAPGGGYAARFSPVR